MVYISEDGCGQALALEGMGNFIWATESVDIPDLPNYSSQPLNDFDSCKNTQTVIDYSYNYYGDRAHEYYPAFWQAYNYTPSIMPETKGKWCIPAGGVLNSIYQNKASIDQSLTRINKENIGSSSWWSSSEESSNSAWFWYASSGDFGFGYYGKHNFDYVVRPVIEF